MNIAIMAMSMHMHIIMLFCLYDIRYLPVFPSPGILLLILAPGRELVNSFLLLPP